MYEEKLFNKKVQSFLLKNKLLPQVSNKFNELIFFFELNH